MLTDMQISKTVQQLSEHTAAAATKTESTFREEAVSRQKILHVKSVEIKCRHKKLLIIKWNFSSFTLPSIKSGPACKNSLN